MRILILGNLANDGYAVAKELRKMNECVDLAINTSDVGTALPEWEDANITSKMDLYNVDRNEILRVWEPPQWIRYFDFLNTKSWRKFLFGKIKTRLNIIKIMQEYDVVETHVPWAIYSQFSGVPYVVYDAGWIRYFPYEHNIRSRLAKRGYRKAKSIIYTNPDTIDIFEKLSYIQKEKLHFVPFAIDPEKYKPMNSSEVRHKYAGDADITLFSPARQIWNEKGNDKMIKAYARFTKEYPKSKFILVSWGVDDQRSKKLVDSLGIVNNIVWIKPVPKNKLIEFYNAADIILDQFVIGSWGTSTPEAMSCGKPVLMFYEKRHILRAFGEEPPILNSFTEDDIYNNLMKLTKDTDLRNQIGNKSREWIMKTHSPKLVALKHMEILNSAVKSF